MALGESEGADAEVAARALTHHLMDADRSVYEAVLAALAKTAPRALPAFLAELDPSVVTDSARMRELRDALEPQRARIFEALPRAVEGAPLARRRSIELWLTPLRTTDVPSILPWFENADPMVRIAAARFAGSLRQHADAALAAVARALDDPIAEVRHAAAENLCEFEVGEPRVRDALARARTHTDPIVARTVVVAHAASRLAEWRDQGEQATPESLATIIALCRDERGLLISDLEHARPRIRRLALHVLMAWIGAHESQAAGARAEERAGARTLCERPGSEDLAELSRSLSSDDADVRARAAFDVGLAMRGLAPSVGDALVQRLTALVDDQTPRVRITAALALAELGSRAADARPVLQRLHADDSVLLRRVAEYALRAVATD